MNDLILEFEKEYNRERQTESSISNVLINHYIETSDRRCCYLFEIKHLLDVATPKECFFIEVEDKYRSILCDWYIQWNNGDGKNLDDYLLESNSDIASDLYSYLYEELTGDYYDYDIDKFYKENTITKCCSFSGDAQNFSLLPAYSYLCTIIINNANGDSVKIEKDIVIEDSLFKELLETSLFWHDCRDNLLDQELFDKINRIFEEQISYNILEMSYSVVFTEIINITKSILSQNYADLLTDKFSKSDIDSYFKKHNYKSEDVVLYTSNENNINEVVLHRTIHNNQNYYFDSYIEKIWMSEDTGEVLNNIYYIDRNVEKFFEHKNLDVFTEISKMFIDAGSDTYEKVVSWLKEQYQQSIAFILFQ